MRLTRSTAQARRVVSTTSSRWTISSSYLMAIIPLGLLKQKSRIKCECSLNCQVHVHTQNGVVEQALPHSDLGILSQIAMK
jgi:hypothetical protein